MLWMNCGQTIVLGCIKHSRWLIITRPQPHKCITPLCFNKCSIQTSVNRASISVYWSIKVHIDIQGDMLSDTVDMFMSRCEAQSCHLAVILHTNVPVCRLTIEHWQHFNLGSVYILPQTENQQNTSLHFTVKIPLNIFLAFLPKSLSMGERLLGPINLKHPGQEIKKIKLLTNSEKFKTKCTSLTCKYSHLKVKLQEF